MNLQTMDYMIALADERSVSAAARRLHITQQSLSAHLASVEKELGCRLFERRVPLEITYAGEEFLRYAYSIQKQMKMLHHTFDAIRREEKGLLEVGITSNRGLVILLPVILAFQEAHPGIELKIVEDTNEALVKKLEKGEIHVGVSDFASGHSGIHVVRAYRERVVFVIQKELFARLYGEAAGDVIRRIQEGELKLLEECPLLLGHEEDIAGKYARRLMETFSTSPVVRAEAKNTVLLLELCAAGMGGCFCPEIIVKNTLSQEKKDALLTITLGQEAEYEMYIGWREDWHVIQDFVETMAKQMRN